MPKPAPATELVLLESSGYTSDSPKVLAWITAIYLVSWAQLMTYFSYVPVDRSLPPPSPPSFLLHFWTVSSSTHVGISLTDSHLHPLKDCWPQLILDLIFASSLCCKPLRSCSVINADHASVLFPRCHSLSWTASGNGKEPLIAQPITNKVLSSLALFIHQNNWVHLANISYSCVKLEAKKNVYQWWSSTV